MWILLHVTQLNQFKHFISNHRSWDHFTGVGCSCQKNCWFLISWHHICISQLLLGKIFWLDFWLLWLRFGIIIIISLFSQENVLRWGWTWSVLSVHRKFQNKNITTFNTLTNALDFCNLWKIICHGHKKSGRIAVKKMQKTIISRHKSGDELTCISLIQNLFNIDELRICWLGIWLLSCLLLCLLILLFIRLGILLFLLIQRICRVTILFGFLWLIFIFVFRITISILLSCLLTLSINLSWLFYNFNLTQSILRCRIIFILLISIIWTFLFRLFGWCRRWLIYLLETICDINNWSCWVVIVILDSKIDALSIAR